MAMVDWMASICRMGGFCFVCSWVHGVLGVDPVWSSVFAMVFFLFLSAFFLFSSSDVPIIEAFPAVLIGAHPAGL